MSKQKFLDYRNIENGMVIGEYRYSDQPYIIETEDGAWLCVMTAGNSLHDPFREKCRKWG